MSSISNIQLTEFFARDSIPLKELTQLWLQLDKNPTTLSEIRSLASSNNDKELELRLATRIQFGTAGTPSKKKKLSEVSAVVWKPVFRV
jgi:hypothetical protein